MEQAESTRRNLLLAAVGAAPVLAQNRPRQLQAEASPPAPVPIGISTMDFREHTNASLAKELKAQGIRRIQLFLTQKDSNYWRYNQRVSLEGLTAQRCRDIAGAYTSQGISIHSIGVYPNLIHPDEAERRAQLAYFDAMIKVGKQMGVRIFVTEAGHYLPPGAKTSPFYDYQEAVWNTALASVRDLARFAEAEDAVILLEPSHLSVFATAKRTRVFLEEVGSQRIRCLLDPANLIEFNDVAEMFDQLQPYISALHAKDRKLRASGGVPAGQGDLDYRQFVTLAATRTPNVPMLLEYVG